MVKEAFYRYIYDDIILKTNDDNATNSINIADSNETSNFIKNFLI